MPYGVLGRRKPARTPEKMGKSNLSQRDKPPPGEPTNCIKYTKITADNREDNTYQYTTAIKTYNQFAFVAHATQWRLIR